MASFYTPTMFNVFGNADPIRSDNTQLRCPVSIQTQSLALASSQSWLPLLRPSIPIGCLPTLRLNGNRA